MLQIFKNIYDNEPYSGCTLHQWFSNITGGTYIHQVNQIRSDKKYLKNQLPSVLYNFNVEGTRLIENTTISTGYLFYDLDKKEINKFNFDVNSIDLSKIKMKYQSSSGTGYHFIVEVKNVTKDNFITIYENIGKELGLTNVLDNHCKSVSRLSIISYDPNGYWNDNNIVFDGNDYSNKIEYINENKEVKKSVLSSIHDIQNTNILLTTPNFTNYSTKIYTDNSHLLWEKYSKDDKQEYIYFPERTEKYIKCFLFKNKIKDNRKTTLRSYITNLLFCNDIIDESRMIKFIKGYCDHQFSEPISDELIIKIYREKVKEYQDKKLKEIYYHKQRMVIFNPYMKIDIERKKEIVLKLIQQEKRNNTRNKIESLIDSYVSDINEKKLTNKLISEMTGLSIDTIKRQMVEIRKDEYYSNLINSNHEKFESKRNKYYKRKKTMNNESKEIKDISNNCVETDEEKGRQELIELLEILLKKFDIELTDKICDKFLILLEDEDVLLSSTEFKIKQIKNIILL